MHIDPPISSRVLDGTNTNSTTGMVLDDTAHRSSSLSIPASSRNITTERAHGSILSQHLENNGQNKARSKDGGERYNPVATVQLLQNTPSRSFPNTSMGTEQLHDLGIGKSSLRVWNRSS